MKNILIVKPSALGDVIQATCVLPGLKRLSPDGRISWLVFSHNADIVADHPLIDGVVSVSRKTGAWRQLPGLAARLRAAGFDAVIDLQGLLRSALFGFMTGAPRRIGFANGRERSTLFYTESHDIPTRRMHAVDGYLRLIEALGAPPAPPPAEVSFPLPLTERHRERIRELTSDFVGEAPLVTICPTAKWVTKRWPEEHFAALADLLAGREKARIAFCGAPDDAEAIGRIMGKMRRPSLDLSGRLSLMELAALLERSDLYVGNDSGPMHLASATRTPTVAIFGPTDPKRTGPYNTRASVVASPLDCAPCFRRKCPTNECLRRLAPEEVHAACLERLKGGVRPCG
jgi:lipopolysaccharide heptosyltransferase I